MSIFVCSDIHMAVDSLQTLLGKAGSSVEAVLFAGDLTNWGNRKDALRVLQCFASLSLFAIPGNLDTKEVMEVMEEEEIDIHGRERPWKDWTVVGFGGGSLNNPGDILFSEEEITNALGPLLVETDSKKTILLTHQPPFGTKLDQVRGGHVGSKAVRKLIETYQPVFHFCGHIHESWADEKIGVTQSFNVAAVKEGRAFLLDLETRTGKRL